MAEWSNNDLQTVNPGESVVFTENPVPCNRGFIQHRDNTGNFQLSSWTPAYNGCGCGCRNKYANYLVDFGANIAIPEGETVGPVSVAFALDGNTLAGTEMEVTPAAVEQYFNVSRAANVSIWKGCCQTLSIRNTGTTPILVQAANIVFAKK